MSDLLAEMALASGERAARLKRAGGATLRRRAVDAPPPAVLCGSPSRFDIFAEIKLRSPSAGALVEPVGDGESLVVNRAQAYQQGGAAAVSVLTEPARFGGALSHLTAAAAAVAIPVLRKDFVVHPLQLFEARAAGASGVLLIQRMLPGGLLAEMLDAAAEAGLFVLLESFAADELRRCSRAIDGRDAPQVLLGLNARNLANLEVDPDRHRRLAHRFPPGVATVAESGIDGAAGAAAVAALGYTHALVGSALMRTGEPAAALAAMIAAGRRARRAA